jgi:lipid-A-disaccharide synthase
MLIGRRLIRIPYIGMVNLIAQKGICPEFIQEQFQPKSLVRSAEGILTSPERYQEMKEDLYKVRAKMSENSATTETANAIAEFFQ